MQIDISKGNSIN